MRKMKRTKKQAQRRNFCKYRLLGMRAQLKNMRQIKNEISVSERIGFNGCLGLIDKVIQNWDQNTVKLGFNSKNG